MQFTIYANKNFNNAIFIKTNTKNNLTYMCSSMQKVALCLQAHNLKNATVKLANALKLKRFTFCIQVLGSCLKAACCCAFKLRIILFVFCVYTLEALMFALCINTLLVVLQ